MLDPESPLVRDAMFGKQVEQFLDGDIGNYLVKRAQTEIDVAIEKLKKVNPVDVDLVRTYQNDVKVAEFFIVWLGDAIAAGHAAIETLEGEENG